MVKPSLIELKFKEQINIVFFDDNVGGIFQINSWYASWSPSVILRSPHHHPGKNFINGM